MTEQPAEQRRPKRLDERVAPGWANLSATLLRGGGVLAGLFLLWIGLVTGGFFIVLTGILGVLALIGGWLLGGLMTRESWYERPNARQLSIALVIGFPLALVAVAQLAGPLLTPPPSLAVCWSDSLARGEERHEQLAVDPRIDSMVFRLVIHDVTGGALRYFVVDANGESVWSGRPDIAGTYQSDRIESHGGQWMVNLIAEAEQATYQLEWTATTADGQSGVPNCP